jgi:hypothetical protein
MKPVTNRTRRGARRLTGAALLAAGLCAAPAFTRTGAQDADRGAPAADAPTLEETRLTMSKWIETQQIISKEQSDWFQGREILLGRLELVKKEIATLEGQLGAAQADLDAVAAKRAELAEQQRELQSVSSSLAGRAASLEERVRALHASLPAPLQERIEPLYERMPADPANTRVSEAERFQNVLGILNAINQANQELSVHFEVRTMPDGAPAEVRVLYVGLAQAYYLSAAGEAGIGHPDAEGWRWEPADEIADDLLTALEIQQGKHTPAFVPLPARIR